MLFSGFFSTNSIVSSAIDILIEKSCSFIFATHLHELFNFKLIKNYINMRKIDIYHLHIKIIDDVIYYERKLKVLKEV